MSIRKISMKVTAALLLLVVMTGGCDGNRQETVVSRVRVLQGAEQCALPGETFEKVLRVELQGPQRRGMLGGAGERPPVTGRTVHFVPVDHSKLTVTPATAVSDAGGTVAVKVTAGHETGDHYLKIIPEGAEDKSVTVRFITGIRISGAEQEQSGGELTADPLTVKVVDQAGRPAADVPVFFRLGVTPEGTAPKAEIQGADGKTDQNGEARCFVKLGDKSGEYHVNVEVADAERGIFMRGKTVRVLGINVWSVVIAVLGGLTIFVFGMKLMGDGLQKVAGENMRRILQFFARNGIVAVLAGTLVTAVIQSSSATTVMVIGFINAGLLSLTQSIGIIFGANVGTTVTAQIISFNLSGIAMPAITLGFIITLFRKETVKGWGETILGFGLLFFGMSTMSDELKMLGTFPSFVNVFQSFDCTPSVAGGLMPFGAILGAIGIGIAATVVIQSSSAAMGIVLALAGGGLINFYTAVPLLLGTNIGTTITAFLASLAANRVAKQAALAHSLFNVIGTAIMLVLFYVPYGPDRIPVFLYFINAITPGNVFAAVPQGMERHIAMAHTFFNITVTLILLPFIGWFARLCEFLLPIREKEEVKFQMLEPHLLATPSIALEQSIFAIRRMVKDSWKMVDRAVNEYFMEGRTEAEGIKALAEAEERIDRMQEEVTAYLVQITRRELSGPQSSLVPLLMHCTNDAERIADHTENILQLTERLVKLGKPISDQARKDLQKIWALLDEEAKNVITALGSSDPREIELALKSEQKINKLTDKYESAHIERLRKGSCNLAISVIFIEMLGELEKLGDHLSNIAERTPEIQKHYIKL